MERIEFSWYDYTLFTLMLGASALIGVYFGCFGQKQSTANDYLLGGKSMKVIPIAMSMIASHVSGITILAVPADIYKFGMNYSFVLVSVLVNCFLATYVTIPIFHNLNITSTYEYLELRFNSQIRILASMLYTLYMILYLPIVVYIPALAFAQVTSLNLHLINPFICAICIFYTTIGGLKAVVWTDTLQFTAMIGAIIAVLYMGVASVGGMETVWSRSMEGKRLEIDFDVDPTKRDTFWAVVIGYTTYWIPHVVIGQGSVQKLLSLPNMAAVKRTLLVFAVGIIGCKGACIFTGLIIYAKYFDCDPFLTKQVARNDQLLPFYVMEVASKIPGLPGLFIAGIFCAALSTLSAAMNSLSGTIYEDFVSKFMPKNITQKKVSNILKLIVVIIGVVATSLVFLVERLGGLLALSIAFSSITSGPLLGLFTLGMIFPSANSKGALLGAVTSLVVLSWIVIGAQLSKAQGLLKYTPKPLSVDGCLFNSTSTIVEQPVVLQQGDVFVLYRITYYYYTLIGAAIVLIIGLPISWYTKINDLAVDKKLITPFMHWALPKETSAQQTIYHDIDKALQLLEENLKK